MKYIVAALAAGAAQAIIYDKYSHLLAMQQLLNGFSPIDITVDGKKETYYVAANFSSSGGSNYDCPSNGRGYVSLTAEMDHSNPVYFTPGMLGGSIEWDVDLSDHECGCIAAFYTVSMPGKDEAGNVWVDTDGWAYCDANMVDGNYCPEMDLMEANKWAWATTPHKCDAPSGTGHYYYCDRNGSGMNTKDVLQWNGYGPGQDYTINTEQAFHAKISFTSDGSGNLVGVTTTFSQNGAQQEMTNTDAGYLAQMSHDIANGMGLVISNWGGDASWLWGDKCYGSCNWPQLTISNIKISTGSNKKAEMPTAYNPNYFEFGKTCNDIVQQCDVIGCPTVDHCRWSWPQDESWDSDHAMCRCDIAP